MSNYSQKYRTFASAKTTENKSMSNKIKHSGVVESIEDGCVHVRIVQTTACAACKVAGHCNAAESKEKLVDVYTHDYHGKVGDNVMVTTSGQVAMRALLYGFGLPFLILVTVLFALLQITGNEGVAALGGIGALVPYYGVLWLFRDKMQAQLAFTIE